MISTKNEVPCVLYTTPRCSSFSRHLRQEFQPSGGLIGLVKTPSKIILLVYELGSVVSPKCGKNII